MSNFITKFIYDFIDLPHGIQVAVLDELQKIIKITYDQDVHVQETPQTGLDENDSEDFTGRVPSDIDASVRVRSRNTGPFDESGQFTGNIFGEQ